MLSRLLSYRFCQSVLNKVKNRIKLPLRRGGRYGEVGGNMTPDFLIFVFGTGGRVGGDFLSRASTLKTNEQNKNDLN